MLDDARLEKVPQNHALQGMIEIRAYYNMRINQMTWLVKTTKTLFRNSCQIFLRPKESSFPFSDIYVLFNFLRCYFSRTVDTFHLGKCLLDFYQLLLIFFLWNLALFFIYHIRRQVYFCISLQLFSVKKIIFVVFYSDCLAPL